MCLCDDCADLRKLRNWNPSDWFRYGHLLHCQYSGITGHQPRDHQSFQIDPSLWSYSSWSYRSGRCRLQRRNATRARQVASLAWWSGHVLRGSYLSWTLWRCVEHADQRSVIVAWYMKILLTAVYKNLHLLISVEHVYLVLVHQHHYAFDYACESAVGYKFVVSAI